MRQVAKMAKAAKVAKWRVGACVLAATLAMSLILGATGCGKFISQEAMPGAEGGALRSPADTWVPTTADVVETEGGLYGMPELLPGPEPAPTDPFNTEEYAAVTEHGFTSVLSRPFSTFAADVDTASYCNLRRMIRDGQNIGDIPAGAVRIEEMMNYFTYSFPTPVGNDLFAVTPIIGDCPWNPDTKLLVIGLAAQQARTQESTGNNLVFLIDVSGSMDAPDKLGLLQDTFAYLLEQLGEGDTVSIVTYAGQERVVLDGVSATRHDTILRALKRLRADGFTNGQAGLAMAYDVAAKHFIPGGNNRIIMASDGDLNVGITSQSDLEDFVASKRDEGIYLSVLGFGTGNFKDTKMETIADAGNGAYYYIDCADEARRIFGEQLTRTLVTVANDVKFQLEFNPAYVKGYRQIGYENRELTDDQFKDDKVDAGEVGSGAQLVVAYELVMVDSALELFTADSRYGAGSVGVENGEWFALGVRWKEPGAKASDAATQRTYTFGEECYAADADASTLGTDWAFVSQVIRFGMLLGESEHVGTTTLAALQEEVMAAHYTDERRAEFAKLVLRVME